MREFKFIRGIYKNEKIFNTDETDGTLFALYGDGKFASLDIKNDETFQKTIAGLEPDNREIYTVRPSQFSVKATKQNDNEYTVTYTLNEKTYDGSKAFPDNVKEAAENHLSENTTADIPVKPSLILSGDSENATIVTFTFEGKTHINKSLFFRVTGDMKEFTRTEAEGEGITAYKVVDNKVNYNNSDYGTFYNGKLQEIVNPKIRDIAPDSRDVNDENYYELDVASSYTADEGFMFVYNSQLINTISYNEPLNANLYKKINDYLVEVDYSTAVDPTTRQLKSGFVAYRITDCSSLNLCYEEDTYEFSEDGCIQTASVPQNNSSDYRFFKRNLENTVAYALVGECVAQPRDPNTIVKNYENSYSKYFILDGMSLRELKNDDIKNKESIGVYTEIKNTYNYPSFGGVYEDKDTAYYVTLSDEKSEDISKYNATTYGGVVSPIQDDSTFRQIENIYITATES